MSNTHWVFCENITVSNLNHKKRKFTSYILSKHWNLLNFHFYQRYPVAANTDGSDTNAINNQKLYYHRLGKNQNDDILIAEFPEYPDWQM